MPLRTIKQTNIAAFSASESPSDQSVETHDTDNPIYQIWVPEPTSASLRPTAGMVKAAVREIYPGQAISPHLDAIPDAEIVSISFAGVDTWLVAGQITEAGKEELRGELVKSLSMTDAVWFIALCIAANATSLDEDAAMLSMNNAAASMDHGEADALALRLDSADLPGDRAGNTGELQRRLAAVFLTGGTDVLASYAVQVHNPALIDAITQVVKARFGDTTAYGFRSADVKPVSRIA